ncbi:MAG TPA: histidinol phosphate phosphatase [Treponema sp.]|nr:histidinol phosphate phosphatase [Treponema sp.]
MALKQIKTNYHTHSTWCDGRYSTKEMILAAIEKDFTHLGFSSHAMYPFSTKYHLNPKTIQDYTNEIQSLKEDFKDKIEIFHGFEAEFIPPLSKPSYALYKDFSPDYLIGSVHYLFDPDARAIKNKAGIPDFFFPVDNTAEELVSGIQRVFNGNTKKAIQTYFYLQREMMKQGDFDIIGHIDVIKKRNQEIAFYDENARWYKNELLATAKEAKRQNKIVEINTSALARSLHKEVYPSTVFIDYLVSLGVPLMLNSDSHSPRFLDSEFENTKELLKTRGLRELFYLTKKGWERQSL